MKQVIQSLRTGELDLVEVPEPACLPGYVLVRNAFSFVSPGTERAAREIARSSLLEKARKRPDQVLKVIDKVRTEGLFSTLQKVKARLEEPAPLGYSCAGRVIEIGEGVEGIRPGDRVACAGAGYANHAHVVSVPKNLVARIPDPVPYDEACSATLCAIALQGVRVARLELGETVGVIGLGLLGQITVQLLKANGCSVIGIDLSPRMVEKAREMGVDQALLRSDPVEEIALSMTDGHGLDAVIITAATDSKDPVELAGNLCRRKGRVVAVGAFPMDIPRRTYYPKELDLRLSTSYGPGRYDPEYEERGHDYPYAYVRFTEQRNLLTALGLMAEGKLRLGPLVTHRFGIEEARSAYDLVEGKTGENSIGILLDYGLADETAGPQSSRPKPASPQAADGTVSVGIVGAGQFASGVLLPRISKMDGVKLAAVATARGTTAAAVAKRYAIPVSTCRSEDVFEDSSIHAVVIATRHHQHAAQVRAAVESGKHVFVEKPLALDRESLAEVAAAVEKSEQTVMVGFNRRFAPLARQAKQWFSPRTWPLTLLGRINAGRIPRDSWLIDPREGGGRILGEVCHFVDLFQYWTGAEVSSVEARGLAAEGEIPRSEENLVVQLGFSDGSIASLLYVSEGAGALSKEYYEIHGGNRSAVLDDFRRLDLFAGGKKQSVKARSQDKGHAAELEHFFTCIGNGRAPELSFESCVATTEVTFQIQDCLRRGATATS